MRKEIAIEQVKYLQSLGYKVLALKPNSKEPLDWGGWKNQSDRVFQILRDFKGEEVNLGIYPTNGKMIIDVDTKEGKQGAQSYQKLCDDFPALKQIVSRRSRSWSGGGHIHLAVPLGFKPDHIKYPEKYPDIEFICSNNYAVCPPSHYLGEEGEGDYAWGVSPEESPLAPAPEDLLRFLSPNLLQKEHFPLTTSVVNLEADSTKQIRVYLNNRKRRFGDVLNDYERKEFTRIYNEVGKNMYIPQRISENNYALTKLAVEIKRRNLFNQVDEIFKLWWGKVIYSTHAKSPDGRLTPGEKQEVGIRGYYKSLLLQMVKGMVLGDGFNKNYPAFKAGAREINRMLKPLGLKWRSYYVWWVLRHVLNGEGRLGCRSMVMNWKTVARHLRILTEKGYIVKTEPGSWALHKSARYRVIQEIEIEWWQGGGKPEGSRLTGSERFTIWKRTGNIGGKPGYVDKHFAAW